MRPGSAAECGCQESCQISRLPLILPPLNFRLARFQSAFGLPAPTPGRHPLICLLHNLPAFFHWSRIWHSQRRRRSKRVQCRQQPRLNWSCCASSAVFLCLESSLSYDHPDCFALRSLERLNYHTFHSGSPESIAEVPV